MNKFLIILLFLALPFDVKAGFPEGKDGFNIKKIEKSYRLPCKDIGNDKCIARSIGISACTLVYGIEANRSFQESLRTTDLIFRALIKGNTLDVNSIFDKNNSIKKDIKDEAFKTIKYCRENIKKVIPKITNLPEEEFNERRIEELTDTYPEWYLYTLEEIRMGK